MKSKVKIVLVGGGTGGHFYPLMSIADALNEEATRPMLYYMGPEPYDADALATRGITFVSCPSGKLRRYASFLNVLDFFLLCAGIGVACIKLFTIYPDVVMSKGGYTSVPVLFAAWFFRIPVVIHESDAVPGKANRLGGKIARSIAISYEVTRAHFKKSKTVLTGIPIRKELLAPAEADMRNSLGLTSELPLILILGGSLGAERINNLILDSLDELLPRYEIIHQTGRDHFNIITQSATQLITDPEFRARYHPVAFLDARTLNQAYHSAALIISRAGSGSIHEIAIHGKPAILIPIPEHISHDQRTNAYAYARAGGATVIEEHNLKDGLLVPEIDRIMQNPDIHGALSNGANSFATRNGAMEISQLIMNIVAEH